METFDHFAADSIVHLGTFDYFVQWPVVHLEIFEVDVGSGIFGYLPVRPIEAEPTSEDGLGSALVE